MRDTGTLSHTRWTCKCLRTQEMEDRRLDRLGPWETPWGDIPAVNASKKGWHAIPPLGRSGVKEEVTRAVPGDEPSGSSA